MPIPILFTIPNFITAGSGEVLMNVVERIDRERFAPVVCVGRRGGRLDRKVVELAIPLLEAPLTVPAKPYASLPVRARRAAEPFRDYGFKLWHSFHYLDDYTEALIARLAGAAWLFTKKNMSWGSRAWLVRSYLASRVVANNSDMPRSMFDRFGLRHKVEVVHHGLPVDRFAPEHPGTGLRQRLGLTADEVLVGCSSHLVPVKEHPTLIEAVARVGGIHLALGGAPRDAAYADSLRARVEELGIAQRVSFVGELADVAAFLVDLDIFVLPSRKEGFPLALLEAMACGRACVASDLPGTRDQIEADTRGRLVPAGDAEALAGALRDLASSPETRDRLGQAARQRVLDGFTIEREVARLEKIYGELAAA